MNRIHLLRSDLLFLEGPIVNGSISDTAIFNGTRIIGKKNLPMTSSYFFVNQSIYPNYPDPNNFYEFYNFFNGRYGLSGQPFQDQQGNITKFVFSGNPVTGSGWLAGKTIPPTDIREGLVTGPFNFAPGDSQEVVVAEIAGVGKDYLHSIYTVKEYRYQAMEAYRNLVNGIETPAPKSPAMTLSNNNGSIQITWDNSAESFNKSGFSFEGYNVYQLSSPEDSKETAKLIATFDKNDGITTLSGKTLDPQTYQIADQIQQHGTDSGLQYSFSPDKDYITDSPSIIGKKYYYAVTAYTYNQSSAAEATNTESIFEPENVAYDYNISGPNFGDHSSAIHTSGSADCNVEIAIADPSKITDHQYQVSFHDEKYTLGSDGIWSDITAQRKSIMKPTDLTGSSLTNTATWSEGKNKIMLHYLVNITSPNYDFCDGVILKLPANINVDTIYNPISNNDGLAIPYTFNRSTNTIFFGDSGRTTAGSFTGGEDISILIELPNLPMTTNYTMYDDNWGEATEHGGTIVDVHNSVNLTTIDNQYVTQHQWDVTDLTSGKIVLKNQTIYNNNDIYAKNYYFQNFGTMGPGGSSGSLFEYVGISDDSVFDGIKVDVNGNFNVPTTIGSLELNGAPLGIYLDPGLSTTKYSITDFTAFSLNNGNAVTSLPAYQLQGGTNSLIDLQQDYEIRWTGVLGDTTAGGKTIKITKSGGSYATLFGASGYNLADDPVNPNPGSNSPFLIRIPFEVWNTVKNEQVNLLVWDRFGSLADSNYQVWNTLARMYCWVVNTKYSPTVLNTSGSAVADSATWSWVFFKSTFNTGDIIKIAYNNPIQVGLDKFNFTVTEALSPVKRDENIIKNFSLSQNYPNPFNPTTTINYSVPKTSLVTLKVYDILGREITTLLNGEKSIGNYTLNFNANRYASGVYIYQLRAGNFISTKKMLLLK